MHRITVIAFAVLAGFASALLLSGVRDGAPPTLVVERVDPRGGRAEAAGDWAAVARRAAPAVAVVRARFGSDAATDAQGTAFAIDRQGHLISNDHVLVRAEGGETEVADQIWVDYPDGRQSRARIIGRAPDSDLVLLRALDARPASSLALGRSGDLELGDAVATMGAPAGLAGSLSIGVVSALGRAIPAPGGRFVINQAIQTDALIGPGSSGGPLLDADGDVIGVAAQFESRESGGAAGFAIPSDLLVRLLGRLREGGVVRQGLLGVTTETATDQLGRAHGAASPGALVQAVTAGSPAAEAGLVAGSRKVEFYGREVRVGGDVIVSLDDEPITSSADLAMEVSLSRPGRTVRLGVVRDGQARQVEVRLAARPGG